MDKQKPRRPEGGKPTTAKTPSAPTPKKPYSGPKTASGPHSVGPGRPMGGGKIGGPGKPGGFDKSRGQGRPGNPPRPQPQGKPGTRPGVRPTRPANPPLPAPVTGTQARLLALDTLLDVHLQGAYASLALGERLRRGSLDDRDKRLATELVYGPLERQIQLDYVLDRYLERKDLDPIIRDILRQGAYQLLFLTRVPPSAAVDESVKLTRMKQRDQFAALVNALLRRLDRERDSIAYPDPQEDPISRLSVMNSMPRWLVARMIAAYGQEKAQDILSYQPEDRYVVLRANRERSSTEAVAALLDRLGTSHTPGKVPGAIRVLGGGDLTRLIEYQRGEFSIQGESAMLAAQVVDVKRGGSVLDACAAPGGKTAYLAESLMGTGRVYAWDLHEHRVELLRAMAKRLHLDNVRFAERDATQPREDLAQTMDAVLLDAPCSGTGLLWEKPDLRYRLTLESVDDMVKVQAALLSACCDYVKPGGLLVYATCSILPEENEKQIEAFLSNHPDFSPDPEGLSALVPDFLAPHVTREGLQILPKRDGMEGFFLCRMRRRA